MHPESGIRDKSRSAFVLLPKSRGCPQPPENNASLLTWRRHNFPRPLRQKLLFRRSSPDSPPMSEERISRERVQQPPTQSWWKWIWASRGTADTTLSTQPQPQEPSRVRTLRISSIPHSVTKDELRTYLKELLGYDDFPFSLVPATYSAVATVTLTGGEPTALSACTPGRRIYQHHQRTGVELVVDCEFHGMTPLYSADEPTVE